MFVLVCISLMTKDVEHFFRCFSAIQYSSVENSLFSSVPHFSIWLFGSLESNFLSSLYILYISPLLDVGLVKIFSQFLGCRSETADLARMWRKRNTPPLVVGL